MLVEDGAGSRAPSANAGEAEGNGSTTCARLGEEGASTETGSGVGLSPVSAVGVGEASGKRLDAALDEGVGDEVASGTVCGGDSAAGLVGPGAGSDVAREEDSVDEVGEAEAVVDEVVSEVVGSACGSCGCGRAGGGGCRDGGAGGDDGGDRLSPFFG